MFKEKYDISAPETHAENISKKIIIPNITRFSNWKKVKST